MENNYISLHCHSDYSFLDSVAKISDLTKKARNLNMPGLALTDHGNICGWLKFYEHCTNPKFGKALKPIFGMEAYVTDDAELINRINSRIEILEIEKKDYLPLFAFSDMLLKEAEKAFNKNPNAFEDDEDLSDEERRLMEKNEENDETKSFENPNRGDDFEHIFGNEIDPSIKIEKLKQLKNDNKKSNHLILLAKNKTGYNNIIKLSSYGWLNGLYYKPRIDINILEKHKEGIIVLSACLGGQIASNILKNNFEKAEHYISEYKRIFKDDFYLEFQLHEIEEQKKVNSKLIEYMKKYRIEPVITQDIHYVEKEDVELHEIVIKLKRKEKDIKEEDTKLKELKEETEKINSIKDDKEDSDSYFYSTRSLYFKSFDEMKKSWEVDHPYMDEKIFKRAIDNSEKIFNKVENIKVRNDKPLLPNFDTGNLSAREFILNIIKEGAKMKLAHKIKENPDLKNTYQKRIKEELDTICELNFEQYFLIEWDMMRMCKENDIMTGPGRGSAAGSLIAYCLGITDIDPIEHDLLFSRFINKSRSGAKFKLEFDEFKIEQKV